MKYLTEGHPAVKFFEYVSLFHNFHVLENTQVMCYFYIWENELQKSALFNSREISGLLDTKKRV